MERNPPPTRTLHTIERLQGWSMLGFYPLEHLYYLRSHDLIPASIPALSVILGRRSKRISLDAGKLILWSCRFWLLYVVLQFAHLREDRKLLLMRQKNLKKGKALSAEDKEDLRNRWDAFWNELVANAAILPVALHWFVFDYMREMHTDLPSGLWRVVSSETTYVIFKLLPTSCITDASCRFGSPSSVSSMVSLHSEAAGEQRSFHLSKPQRPPILQTLLDRWRKLRISDRIISEICAFALHTCGSHPTYPI
jgi:hypothetical protein